MNKIALIWHALARFGLLALGLLLSAGPAAAQVCVNPGLQGDVTLSTPGVVNGYFTPAAGTTLNVGTSPTFTIGGGRGATTWVAGDMAMLIQMQCVDMNRTDSDNYGDGGAGRPASGYIETAGSDCKVGQYEYVLAAAGTNATTFVTGANLQFKYVQANPTSSSTRRSFQVVRVPQYRNLTLGAQLNTLPWNGNNGGVIALDVAKTMDFGGQVLSAAVSGFRGGGGRSSTANGNNPVRARTGDGVAHAGKGEGIAGTPQLLWIDDTPFDQSLIVGTTVDGTGSASTGYPGTGTTVDFDFARGAPGNAGGGGQYFDGAYHNGGGGGGGNGGAGGRGAYGWRNAGWAGVLSDYSNVEAITTQHLAAYGGSLFGGASLARVVMGGGGGAGDNNANSGTPVEMVGRTGGGVGGGIIMVRAGALTGSGVFDVRGGSANHNPCNDAAGAGAAAGSVIVISPNWTSGSLSVLGQGGAGGDSWRFDLGCGVPGSPHSGGGGGAGGVVVRAGAISVDLTGGINGKTNLAGSPPPGGEDHGALAGGDGLDLLVAEAPATPPNVGYRCLPQVDLSLSKSATPTAVTVGQSVTFTLVIGNAGPSTATAATIQDVLPAGLGTISFVAAAGSNASTTLTAGTITGTSTFNGTATVPPNQTLTLTLRALSAFNGVALNIATVSPPNGATDVNLSNNTGSATVIVGPSADLTASKFATPSFITQGQSATFTLVFTNAGPDPVTGARITDTFPSSFGTVTFRSSSGASGASLTANNVAGLVFTGTATLPVGSTLTVVLTAVGGTGGSVINTTTIAATAGIADPTPSNNVGTAAIAVGLLADLSITKSATPTVVLYDGTSTFTLTVVNFGPNTATNATVADKLPSGLSGLTVTNVTTAGGAVVNSSVVVPGSSLNATVTMPPNSTVVWTFRVITGAFGSLVNRATVTLPSDRIDPTPSNNVTQATVTVQVSTALAITKSNSVTALLAGQTTVYTITVGNDGPNAANNALISDPVAAGLNCTTVTCSASFGAICPTAPISIAALQGAGVAIATFPSNSLLTFSVTCGVTATGQ